MKPSKSKTNKPTRKFVFPGENRILTAESVVGHAQKSEAIQPEYVEDVSILGEANPRIGLRRKLLQNPASYRPCVPGDGAELGQHHGAPSNNRVEYRHLRPVPLGLGLGALSTSISIESKSHRAI